MVFEGGPGGSCHRGDPFFAGLAKTWNVVLFDQRGICLSRPDSEALYQRSDFYSSLNTVRDADLIRQHLGIESWSTVGASYGSVLATMSASIFEANTRAVLLIGSIYNGRNDADRENLRRFHGRAKIFDDLRAELRTMPEGLETYIYKGDSGRSLESWIDVTLASYGSHRLPSLAYVLRRNVRKRDRTEVQIGRPDAPAEWLRRPEPRAHEVLHVERQTYRARDYPVYVPITYLQGGSMTRALRRGWRFGITSRSRAGTPKLCSSADWATRSNPTRR